MYNIYIIIKLCKTAGSIHLFQNYRHASTWKSKIKMKLHLGYHRNLLEGGQCDI